MQVRVALRDNPYSVHVGAGLLAQVGEIACRALKNPASRAFLVVDSGVPAAAADSAARSLSDRNLAVSRSVISPSERAKSLGTLQRLLQEIAKTRHERTDVVVALGGGVVGDLA